MLLKSRFLLVHIYVVAGKADMNVNEYKCVLVFITACISNFFQCPIYIAAMWIIYSDHCRCEG